MLKEWLTRLRFLMSPKPNREIDDEVQFHIERQAQEYIATGMTPQEAHRKAVVMFGGIESVRAQSHEQRPSFLLGTLLQDVSYALRQLRKSRGFTVTAVLSLALGIGANAAIFTLVNAILLKNLPVVDPSTLIRIGNTTECCVNSGTAEDSGASDDGSYALFATDTWRQLQKNAPEFEELAAMQSGFGTIIARPDKTQEAARSVTGEFVSGNYFRTFGLQPSIGRLFTDADNIIGAPLVAVISYNTWQNHYGSDPSVVGSTFWINTKAVTITGIAPKGFYGDRLSSDPPDFYLPIESVPILTNSTFVHEPGMRWLYIIGRLKPGVAIAPLQVKITELVRQSLASTTAFSGEQGKRALAKAHVVLSPGGAGIQDMQDSYASKLKLLMWISGLVLLIACANIANLLLVRGMNRREEMSVRTALGAMRTRIVRQPYNSATWKDHHMYFLPMTQRIPESVRRRPIEQDTGLYAGAIVIQTDRPMGNIQSIARQTLGAINPNLSVVKFQTFDEQIGDRFTQDRMITRLMTLFSILALLLASLGLYGVTAYTVARRTSEIGIRMALGANRSSVVGMIMRGAMLQTAIGLAAIGIPVAWFCVRYIESQLYESKGMSLAVLTIATLTLTAAAAAAGLIPAQRAASTNPSQALRTE